MKKLQTNNRVFWAFGIIFLCLFARPSVGADNSFFEFKDAIGLGAELDGVFAGGYGGGAIVLGGFKQTAEQRIANYSVFVLSGGADAWEELPALEHHVYGGAAVSSSEGLICIGGYKDGAISRDVICYTVEKGRLKSKPMPQLPVEIAGVKAALASSRIYAIGSEAAYSLDLLSNDRKWNKLESWLPIEGEITAAAAVSGELYVFTRDNGFNVLRYKSDKGFERLGRTDFNLSGMFASPCGLAHIIFISQSGLSNEILAYHTITDKWVVIGQLPRTVKAAAVVIFNDVEFGVIGAEAAIKVKAVMPATKYGWIDHGVVAAFMIGMLLIGAYLSKREKNSQDYFRGGKRVPWWASGLSIFATGASAVSLMAMPGKAFSSDWIYFTGSYYAIITILPLCIYLYMPIARRLEVSTANEYLERRYNIYLRVAGSLIWSLLQMLGRMAALMILPAIAISSIAGIPIEYSIIIMGVITTCYVFLGGFEGVIWTSVIQAIVMIVAVAACFIWAAAGLDMSASQGWATANAANKLYMFDWSISLIRPCVLVMFLNVFVNTLGMIGDQNYIQRIQCTPNEAEARKAIYMSLAVAVPLNAILFALGTVLYLYYTEKPEMLSPAVKSDGIFPLFAAQNLPVGLAGLVIAAILAATMSTLSSALNSVANLGVEDFYRRFKKNASDHSCVVLGKVLTAAMGVFGTVAAMFLAKTDLTSIWDLCMVIFGVLLGAITGIYTLGIFTKRTNSAGAIAGIIASLAATYYAMNYTHLHFLTYPVVGVGVCYVVGYLTSIIIPCKPKDITGLTVYTLQKKTEQ